MRLVAFARRRERGKDALAIGIVAGVILALIWPGLFLSKTILPVDVLSHVTPWSYYSHDQPPIWNHLIINALLHFYPWRVFTAEALRSGAIPLWNPYMMSGLPFASNTQAAIFYPGNILFLLLPPLRAYVVFVAVHLFLAGLFMYSFLRTISVSRAGSLIGGIAFMGSPFLIGWSEHLPQLGTMIWLPAMLALVEKMLVERSYLYASLAGLVFGIQFLAGFPQFSFFVSLASVIYFLFRAVCLLRERATWKLLLTYLALMVLVATMGLALAAVQLLPSLETTTFMARRGGHNPVSIAYLITLVMPNIFGESSPLHPLGSRILIDCAYVGVLPLLLALTGAFNWKNRYVLFFLLLGFLGITWACSGRPYELLMLLPKYEMFRARSRFLYLVVFSLSALAGLGLDYLASKTSNGASRFERWGPVAICILPLIGILLFIGGVDESTYLYPANALPPADYVSQQAWIALCFLATGVAILYGFLQRRIDRGAFVGVVLALTCADTMVQNGWFYPAIDYDKAYPPTASIEFLQEDDTLYRIARYGAESLDSPLPSNVAMLYGIYDLQGKDVFALERYVHIMNLIEDHGQAIQRGGFPNMQNSTSLDSPLLDLLNVKYILTTQEINNDRFHLAFERDDNDIKIYENMGVLPRAFVVHRAEAILDEEASLTRLGDQAFDPSQMVILHEELSSQARRMNEQTPVRDNSLVDIVAYSPNEIELIAEMKAPGFVVISDVYYPGWKILVDGQEGEINRADYVLRAVYLEEGSYHLRFVFDPLPFKIGLFAAVIALAVSGGTVGHAAYCYVAKRMMAGKGPQ